MAQIPEKGFYYHNKHDPNGSKFNYTYELMGVADHTENHGELFVIYRPLGTDSPAWQQGGLFYARPLSMWGEHVEKNGTSVPRFTKITDQQTIAELMKIRDEMYGE